MLRVLLVTLILLLVLVIAGMFRYSSIITHAADFAGGGKSDLLVVLTGGKGRIAEGLRLLENGAGPMLLVTGVEADASILQNANPGYDLAKLKKDNKLIIDPTARSTRDNAIQTSAMINVINPKPRNLMLITSSYHLPRAEMIFKRILPPDVSISLHSVESDNYNTREWYKSYYGIKLLFTEFVKYIWYYTFLKYY